MKKLVILVIAISVCGRAACQSMEAEIDAIFNEWNEGNHPGGVISVIENGNVVCNRAYGQANIKYGIPIEKETIFNVGSVSKQFTAMGIVLLDLDGKLSIDDDIGKYLPELHEFDSPITIRHLLHHTSGLRSTPELFALAGWRDGDAITTDDDYRYLCKQTDLNFMPGSEFMYSNSGYILLAKIIEFVVGERFNDWMKSNVFIPLDMMDTFVEETNKNSHPELATPYNEYEQDVFTIGENTSMDIGASNVYTTAGDMSKWMFNFRLPTVGWEDAFEAMLTTDNLDSGKKNEYAYGLVLDEYMGNQRVQHTGGVPGFLSYAMYYPKEELTMVLLTNFVSHDVQNKFMQLSHLFLDNKTIKQADETSTQSIALDIEVANKIVGDYWNAKGNYPRRIILEQDALWYLRSNGVKSPMIPIANNEFMIGDITNKVSVQFDLSERNKMILLEKGVKAKTFELYDSTPPTLDELKEYVGTYYSSELETSYKIDLIENQLVGYHNRHGAFPIAILKKDVVDWSGFAVANYQRDDRRKISGFYASVNRVRNVWFEKE